MTAISGNLAYFFFLVEQKSLMSLSLSPGKSSLDFIKAREDRLFVYIGAFSSCHGVK